MTYKEILAYSAGPLLNDTSRAVYTDIVELPYLNIARMNLEEIFELNSIPVTNETSGIINVPAGTTEIGFAVDEPKLPDDLVEIQQLFESVEGQETWVPMTKREFLTPSQPLGTTGVASFRVWSWEDQEIKIPLALNDIDIKIDYVKSLFPLLKLSDLNLKNNIINTSSFLFFQVAGLCAEFVMSDVTRASGLYNKAFGALETSLGISIKGKQNITTRRRPFRASFKRRRMSA